jgi:membrane protein YdbS with pleckstrin-like domain
MNQTKLEKIAQFEKKMSKQRKREVISYIITIMMMLIITETAHQVIFRIGPPIEMWQIIAIRCCIYAVLVIMVWELMFSLPGILKRWDMKYRIKEEEDRLRKKREIYEKMKLVCPLLRTHKFHEIPQDLKPSAILLLDDKYSPEELVETERQDVEDSEVAIEVYQEASPTYWSYLFSKEWLRKID